MHALIGKVKFVGKSAEQVNEDCPQPAVAPVRACR